MDVYVIVSISGDPRSVHRSPVVKDGGTSPNWKGYEMRFNVDEQNCSGLSLQTMSDRTLGDKEIGRAFVPLKQLLYDNAGGSSSEYRELEYQLQRPSGKPKGTVRFAYRFGDKYAKKSPLQLAYPVGASASYPPPPPPTTITSTSTAQGVATPYPAPPQHQQYGYGYPPQHQQYGYGYGQPGMVTAPQRPNRGSRFGMGAAAGLGAGLLGGLLVGELVEDFAYDDVGGYGGDIGYDL